MMKNKSSVKASEPNRYRPPDIPMKVIRHYCRQIAEKFRPDKILLFGSYAYGKPDADSDVDLLVVMPCANQTNQAVRIRLALTAPFPLDLIVRTPQKLRQGLQDGDWFLWDIVENGIVLYEKTNGKMVSQG
jgi:predicted nucleotidyltransferase